MFKVVSMPEDNWATVYHFKLLWKVVGNFSQN